MQFGSSWHNIPTVFFVQIRRSIHPRTHVSNIACAHTLFAISGLCTLTTLGNLAVISRDRYLAVRRPVWYRNHMKISRAFKTVCLPRLISVVYAVLTYFSKRSSRVYTPMAAVFLLVLFPFYLPVITFCYLSSYCRKIFKREIETTHFWKGKKYD